MTWNDRGFSEEDLVRLFERHATDDSWAEVLCMVSGLIASRFISPCIDKLVAAGNDRLAQRCVEVLRDRRQAGHIMLEKMVVVV